MASSTALGDGVDMADVFFNGRINVSQLLLLVFESVLNSNSSAWYISNLDRSSASDSTPYQKLTNEPPTIPPKNIIGQITAHPIWAALSADIFTGQIIASLIVLTFVAVFLLREWISQNARPGVFEDEEVFPDMPPAANDPPLQPAPHPPVPVAPHALPHPADLERQQQNAIRELERLRAREGAHVQKEGSVSENGNGVGDFGMSKVDSKRKKEKVYASDSGTECSDEEGLDHQKGKGRARTTSLKIKSGNLRRRAVNLSSPGSSMTIDPSTFDNSFAPHDSSLESDVGASVETNGTTTTSPTSFSSPSPPLHQYPLPSPTFDPDETPKSSPSRTPQRLHDLTAYHAPEELDPLGSLTSQESYEHHSPDFVEGVEKIDLEWDQSFNSDASLSNDATSHRDESEDAPAASGTIGVYPLQSSSFVPSPGVGVSDARQHSDVFRESPYDIFGLDFDLENEQQHYFLDPDREDLEPPSPRIVPVELPLEVARPAVAVEENGREPEHDLRRDDDDEDEEEPDEDADEELWNDDAHWDGIEVQEVPGGQEQGAEGVPAAPDPNLGLGMRRGDQNVAAAANIELPPDVADDLEGNVEDDMEGAMEGLWF